MNKKAALLLTFKGANPFCAADVQTSSSCSSRMKSFYYTFGATHKNVWASDRP